MPQARLCEPSVDELDATLALDAAGATSPGQGYCASCSGMPA
ncbi:hypothetical protein ACIBW9_35465 [Streptomyces sp. NPDC049541]